MTFRTASSWSLGGSVSGMASAGRNSSIVADDRICSSIVKDNFKWPPIIVGGKMEQNVFSYLTHTPRRGAVLILSVTVCMKSLYPTYSTIFQHPLPLTWFLIVSLRTSKSICGRQLDCLHCRRAEPRHYVPTSVRTNEDRGRQTSSRMKIEAAQRCRRDFWSFEVAEGEKEDA